jgi:hypothetical protein
MQYIDDLITRWVEKCSVLSPSGGEVSMTADSTEVTVDSTEITVDSA